MDWLKKNTALVVSGVIALILVGAAAFYFYGKIASDRDAQAQVDQLNATLTEYQTKIPYPNEENVAKALEEQKKLDQFIKQAARFFPPLSTNLTTNPGEFSLRLLERLDRLERQAKAASVNIPTNNFNFTFGLQKGLLQYDVSSIPSLAFQLNDIEALCGVLYTSKVYSVVSIKRAPVSTNDNAAVTGQYSGDYLNNRKVTTNEAIQAVTAPYETTFRCATRELASVLDGLARSTNGFIVKWVRVLPTDSVESTDQESMGEVGGGGEGFNAQMMARYGINPRMASRYGVRPMMRPTPEAAPYDPTAAAPAAKKTGVVLKEKPLQITLLVEAVKLGTGQ